MRERRFAGQKPTNARSLDLVLYDDRFEITVSFDQCLALSKTCLRAYAEGPEAQTPGVRWTSTQPQQPVGRTYFSDEVRAIWNDAGVCLREVRPS